MISAPTASSQSAGVHLDIPLGRHVGFMGILLPDDEKALVPACRMPSMIPSDRQAARLLQVADRAAEAGWRYE